MEMDMHQKKKMVHNRHVQFYKRYVNYTNIMKIAFVINSLEKIN